MIFSFENKSCKPSDVLQAKAQLSGAEAARVQAEFALAQAQNRFKYVFNHAMENAKTMVMPVVPAGTGWNPPCTG